MESCVARRAPRRRSAGVSALEHVVAGETANRFAAGGPTALSTSTEMNVAPDRRHLCRLPVERPPHFCVNVRIDLFNSSIRLLARSAPRSASYPPGSSRTADRRDLRRASAGSADHHEVDRKIASRLTIIVNSRTGTSRAGSRPKAQTRGRALRRTPSIRATYHRFRRPILVYQPGLGTHFSP